ncbi:MULTISPECIES: hypothetical protein [Rhodobacterales]|uniref:capsular polysaccharide export protein, LipB/KpsS family n=1 Tax=Rhodobacterales TaxID=204455 RepID=UPI003297EF0C
MSKIILHLKSGDASPELNGWHLRLYREIRELCADAGIVCEIQIRDKGLKVGIRSVNDKRFQDGNLHVIDDRSIEAKGVLNAGVAYFWEYWHLDLIGTKAFSSIGGEVYDPASVGPNRANIFFDNLTKRYLHKRRSKYGQPNDIQSIPTGAISVFFQGQYPAAAGATKFSDIEMLLAVQNQAGDRPIVVKPHPLVSDELGLQMMRELARNDERIHVTNANVHDILCKSIATVSVNSTVALEGFMHKVPAILFGKSDFHHFVTTVKSSDNFAHALKTELSRKSGFENYLAWYFLKHCLPLNSGRLHEKIWDRFDHAGFGKEYFK